jgi:1-pyrroline-5-carboxylate dehydrogenase
MTFGLFKLPEPENEPILDHAPGSPERVELKEKLDELSNQVIEIPIIIGGEMYRSEEVKEVVMPHDHSHVMAQAYLADEELLGEAVEAALEARESYLDLPWHERGAIFMRAAELLRGPYRATINAATMLGISKTPYQAEIDSAELIDLLSFNTHWMSQIYGLQPKSSGRALNRLEYRPLEGFVLAITPFNFCSIAGNLPSSPAIMGNTVIWKPASSALYNAYWIMKVFQEAGLPDGVINFTPAHGALVGEVLLDHPELAGVHFTGSLQTLNYIWKRMGRNIETYRQFPRLVGESGGKDFVFVHRSADLHEAVTAIIRGAYGYQGQKCSAVSRTYIPESMWTEVKTLLLEEVESIKVGNISDFTNFMGAMIDEGQFNKVVKYIEYARENTEYELLHGGTYDDSTGYYVYPTVVLAKEPKGKLMTEEIFGPVLTIYLYPEDEYEENLKLCDNTSPYGLSGSIFAKDPEAIAKAEEILRYATGNFYINDKPTGAVVSQQPFGGSRKSGTNDKAGSQLNLLRWVTVRAIKENTVPPRDYHRPFMEEG